MSALLLVNALLPKPQLWPIYVFAVAVAALDGLQRPSLEALVPRIVAYDQQAAAAALSSLRSNIGMILGPAVGGILIATAGVWSAYLVDVLSFGASLLALALMRAVPPASEAEPPSLRRILDGVGYAWSRKDLLGTYLVDLSAMFFAFPYALFPFVKEVGPLIALSFALGLALGCAQPMVMSLLHNIAPAGRMGEAVGVRMSIINASTFAMPLLFGAVGSTLGLAPVFWSIGAALAGGGFFARRR